MVSDKETKIESPLASADGKRNAFYHQCEVKGQPRAYVACIARLEGRMEDDLDCVSAIQRGRCPAKAMREEELLKGKAIYFVERRRVEGFLQQIRAWVMPGRANAVEPPPRPSKKEVRKSIADELNQAGELAQGSFGAAVTRAMEKHHLKRPAGAQPRPGETPAQFLKRIRGEQG